MRQTRRQETTIGRLRHAGELACGRVQDGGLLPPLVTRPYLQGSRPYLQGSILAQLAFLTCKREDRFPLQKDMQPWTFP
jgi:hypothetical protein